MGASGWRGGLWVMLAGALVPAVVAIAATTTAAETPRADDGWVDLLAKAGPELKGWTRVPIPPGGTLGATSQWSLDPKTGHLVCDGNGGHEWLRWDQELGDFVYRVEWRFTPVDGKSGYNSGIYARNSADGTIWHQAQTGSGSGGYLFGQTAAGGKTASINLAKQVQGKPVKPAGDWNTFEIRCQGRTMTLTVNGQETNVWRDCQVPRGYVGVEAEGWRIEFRRIAVKAL